MTFFKSPFVFIVALLDFMLLIGCKAFKKLGPLGFTILTWVAIIFFAFLFPIGLTGCTGPSVNNTTKEDKTMILRFYNYLDFTIPAAPGAIDQNISLLGSVALPYCGIADPYLEPPTAANPPRGCDPNSSLKVLRHRFVGVGIEGLRVGLLDFGTHGTTYPWIGINFNRKLQGQAFDQGIIMPLLNSGEWIEDNCLMESYDSNGYTRPFFNANPTLIFDTRNMDSFYYGKPARLLFEIEVECNTVGF